MIKKLLKQLKEEESESSKGYTVEIPLLLLLFRAFECWDELYWDKIAKYKDRTKEATLGRIGLTSSRSLDERRRLRDIKRLESSAKMLEKEKPVDSHLFILGEEFKDDIVDLFTECFLHSNRVCYLFNNKQLRLAQKGQLRWFANMIIDYFFDNNAFFWGYLNEDKKLLGLSIWERPDSAFKISVYKLIRTSGAYYLGPSRFLETVDILKASERIRKEDIGGINAWMLLWLCVSPFHSRKGIAQIMVENCAKRHQEPIYAQIFDRESESINLFQKLCFITFRTESTNYLSFGSPLKIHSIWHGLESPEELKSQIVVPKKRKGALATTYTTLRKASQGQLTLDKSSANIIAQAGENQEFKLAKLRHEEASLLLDALKINLGQLPVKDVDDDITTDLKARIKEQENTVNIARQQMEFYNAQPKLIAPPQAELTRGRSRTDVFKKRFN